MTIFDFDDYKKFVAFRIKDRPAGGRGAFKAMAEAMNVPRSTLSQVFHGHRDLTFEQAIDLAGFFELASLETEFFMALVERSRAGHARLKAFAERKIEALRERSRSLAGRVPSKAVVNEKARATFYSEWYYSAVRLACNLPGLHTAPAIAAYLGLPLPRTRQVLDFLLKTGLCVKERNGFRMGPSSTHIPNEDPLVFRHHQNWRQCALRRMQEYPYLEDDEYCVTIPCSIDKPAMAEIRKALFDVVVKAGQIVDAAKKEEHLACLTLDLLRLRAKA
jgi:uncharacterized protein (TIGR02147 family)